MIKRWRKLGQLIVDAKIYAQLKRLGCAEPVGEILVERLIQEGFAERFAKNRESSDRGGKWRYVRIKQGMRHFSVQHLIELSQIAGKVRAL